MLHKRILLKLSGEALMGNHKHGIDPLRLDDYAKQIKEVQKEVFIEGITGSLNLP